MKNLTTLHIMMLMGLAVGSIHLHAASDQEFENEAMRFEQKSEQTATLDEVMQDLVEISPAIEQEIAQEEADLQPDFNKIKKFVSEKNKEIEQLKKRTDANEIEIAKLAVQLADAQAAFEKAISIQRAKHKKNHKLEQSISDALKKAEQGLKNLNDGIMRAANVTGAALSQGAKTVSKKIKSSMQSNKNLSAQEKKAARAKLLETMIADVDNNQGQFTDPRLAQPMLMIEHVQPTEEDAIIDQALDAANIDDEEVEVQSMQSSSSHSRMKSAMERQHQNKNTNESAQK
jgi:hypothetical protein